LAQPLDCCPYGLLPLHGEASLSRPLAGWSSPRGTQYVGVEVAYGGWIFTYAVKVFGMGETEADYLSSAFWGAITLGRLLAGTF